jgi:uncharacterized membrane protein HdeD (DUF308 family)
MTEDQLDDAATTEGARDAGDAADADRPQGAGKAAHPEDVGGPASPATPDEVEVEVYDFGPAGYEVIVTPGQQAVRPKTHFWLSFFLPGIAFILMGLAIMVWPKGSVQLFTTLLGVLVAFTGLLLIGGAFQAKRAFGRWGMGLGTGIVLVALGAVSVVFASLIAQFWIFVWAAVAVLGGAWDVASAVMNEQHGRWIRLARGAVLALAGAAVLATPMLGYVFLGLAIGAACLFIGVSTIAIGVAARRAEL